MILDEIIAVVQDIFQTLGSNPIFLKYGLVGLFLNGVLSSTALPIPSEIAMSALLAAGYDKLPVFLVLSAGTIVGGFAGYFLGRSGNKLFNRFRSKPKTQDEEKSHGILTKYGWIAIFAAPWIPVLGDIIHMAAGAKKYDLRMFAIAMSAGKVFRVAVTVYLGSILLGRLFG